MVEPIEISEEQVAKFEKDLEANNRPIQPLHDRELVIEEATGEYRGQ